MDGAGGCRLYRAVAAVVGLLAGGGVRASGGAGRGAGWAGAGEEPAVGGGQARRLRGAAGPGADTGDGVASVGDRTVRAFRAGAVAGSAPDAAHQPAVHRPPGGPAAVSGRCAAAAGTGQGPVQPGGDRRLPGTGGRAARHRAADAGCRAGLPGRGRRADPRRPARCPRQGRDRPIRRAGGSRPRLPPADGAGAGALSRAAAGRSALRRGRAGLRRGRSRPAEPDEPADHRAGRRGRAAPAGHRRLRATWLRDCAELLGLATFMAAAGISCSQRLGNLVTGLEQAGEAAAVLLLGASGRP